MLTPSTIIALSEVWQLDYDEFVAMHPEYKVYYGKRDSGVGGGILLLIPRDYTVQ
jgi:hypothetical protein